MPKGIQYGTGLWRQEYDIIIIIIIIAFAGLVVVATIIMAATSTGGGGARRTTRQDCLSIRAMGGVTTNKKKLN